MIELFLLLLSSLTKNPTILQFTCLTKNWLLGLFVACSLAGYPPFSEEIKKYTLNDQIINGRYSFPAQHWKTVSPQGIYFLSSLLAQRKFSLTVPALFKHLAASQAKEIVQDILVVYMPFLALFLESSRKYRARKDAVFTAFDFLQGFVNKPASPTVPLLVGCSQ